ncbi:hypothetical protein JCM8547_002006 [Rhodosporidiobolus lusitaniae]
MNIDRPLDEVIQEKRKSRGPRRPRGPRNPSNAAPAQAAQAAAPKAAAPAVPAAGQVHVGDKVIISGLPEDVNEQQIRELFTSTVGPVRRVELSYNPQGKSKGVATVHFNKAEHATSAYTQYNKRLIDGKKPMKVEIIVNPNRAGTAGASLAGRLNAAPAPAPTQPAAAKAARSATVSAAGGSAVQQPRAAGGRQGRRGGRGGGRGGRSRGEERPKATLESLDAEMNDYQAQVSAASAPAVTEGGAEGSA